MIEPRNRSMTPRGGWRYTDPLTGIPFKHPDLIVMLQQVRASRTGNGIAMESGWDNVVIEEMCAQNEQYGCTESGRTDIHLTGDDIRRFLTTIAETGIGNLVSDEEHKRRADICLSCPKMGNVSCTFPCGWVSKKLTELLGGRKLHRAPELHKKGCQSCGCNLDAKTYYPLDVLKTVDQKLGKSPDYWSQCWMREG